MVSDSDTDCLIRERDWSLHYDMYHSDSFQVQYCTLRFSARTDTAWRSSFRCRWVNSGFLVLLGFRLLDFSYRGVPKRCTCLGVFSDFDVSMWELTMWMNCQISGIFHFTRKTPLLQILWTFDVNWFRWTLIFAAVGLSGTVLAKSLWAAFKNDSNKLVGELWPFTQNSVISILTLLLCLGQRGLPFFQYIDLWHVLLFYYRIPLFPYRIYRTGISDSYKTYAFDLEVFVWFIWNWRIGVQFVFLLMLILSVSDCIRRCRRSALLPLCPGHLFQGNWKILKFEIWRMSMFHGLYVFWWW